jgi:hypothetical protein
MPCVYKITNLVNGAVCVGQSVLPVKERWAELVEFSQDKDLAKTKMPCLKILVMIKKYGAENFTIDPLVEGNIFPTQLDLIELEEIKKLNAQGITVYHRTGTFIPNKELIDRAESVDEDPDFYYG